MEETLDPPLDYKTIITNSVTIIPGELTTAKEFGWAEGRQVAV